MNFAAIFASLGFRVAGIAGIAAAAFLGFKLMAADADLRAVNAQLKTANASVERLTTNLATCHANGDVLQLALDQQSANIKTLGDEAVSRLAEATETVRKSVAAATQAKAQASRILAMQPQADACKAAYAILGEAGR